MDLIKGMIFSVINKNPFQHHWLKLLELKANTSQVTLCLKTQTAIALQVSVAMAMPCMLIIQKEVTCGFVQL